MARVRRVLAAALSSIITGLLAAVPAAGQQLDDAALYGLRSEATAYEHDWVYVESIDPFDDTNRSWIATLSLQQPFARDEPASIRFQCVTDGQVSATGVFLSWTGYFQGSEDGTVDVRYRFGSAEPSTWHGWELLPSSDNVAHIPWDRAGYFIDRVVNHNNDFALRIRDPASGKIRTFGFSDDGARDMYRRLDC